MNSWQLVFLQSRANESPYEGDRLPAQNWHWPQETWFQKRRSYLRTRQLQIFQELEPA
jgi:hypothetical protein